ncbi:whey acidic protein [Fukomys damarensis]|uniref:whey acidic protein n=1 Tax=Fukomys damarensis TaxID=885580 RepID=UPI00053FC53C|nr:whey acidic protein [Fukomys damarensis]
MRCILSFALGLLTLEAALAVDLDSSSSAKAMCPDLSSSEKMSCKQVKACATNQDCSGNAVCCPSPCGRSCRTPVYNIQNMRNCPWVQPDLTPKVCKFQNDCAKDNDCTNNKRCCFDGCNMRCMGPNAVSPAENPLQ